MENNPLMNVSCEIRFDSNLEESKVCECLMDYIKKELVFQNEFVKQKITSLPKEIRQESAHLRYVPYYIVEENNKILGIGPHVLLVETREYVGFEDFASFVKIGIDNLLKCDLKQVDQIRLVYINKIEDPITESTNLHIAFDDKELGAETDYTFRVRYEMSEDCEVMLRVCNNNAFLPEQDDENPFSVVDLRAIYDTKDSSEIMEKITVAHGFIKDIFEKIVKKSYLKNRWGINV